MPKSAIEKQLMTYGFSIASKSTDGTEAYRHLDGRMLVVNGEQWMVQSPSSDPVSGEELVDLTQLLDKEPIVQSRGTSKRDRAIACIKLLKGNYDLNALKGDDNYKLRVQMLKKLRNTDKVLVKESGVESLRKEFYGVFGVSTQDGFSKHCLAALASIDKHEGRLRKIERKRIARLNATAPKTIILDGKPVIKAKPKGKRQNQREKAELQQELATAIEAKRDLPPIAVPRADARVTVVGGDVRLLEDPNNGIILLQVEKANSQGAICVYNNGTRVAAGVVGNQTLNALRHVDNADIIQAANQLLSPVISTVQVTETAHSHLTAVLNCKEIIAMAAAKVSKKFAAPAGVLKAVGKKAVAVATEKPAKAAKAPKAEKAARGPKVDVAAKITILTKENPYREGTKARTSYELLKKSKTVGQFAELIDASKDDVYAAAYFVKWASEPHGKAPAHIKVG